MSLTATTNPSTWGDNESGNIPSEDNIVLTYPVAAAVSMSDGDFVKLTNTTTNTVEACTATGDTVFGIVLKDADNSSGVAGDIEVPVLRKGFAYVDGIVAASGTYDEPIRMNDVMYLCGSAVASTDVAQVLTSTTDTAVGTAKVARALDYVSTPSADYTLAKIRVYIDTLSKDIV